MDNPAAPIPSISPQPAVVSPAESPNRRWLLWSAIGLTFLTLGIAVGVFSAKFLNQSSAQPPGNFLPTSESIASTLTPAPSPQSPTPFPTLDPTVYWKIHTNDKFKFRFSYPPSWSIEETSRESLKLYPPRPSGVIYKIAPFELRISIFSKVSPQQPGAEPTKDIVLPYEKILEQKIINGLPVTISEFTTEKGYKNLVASIIFPEIEIRIITYPISSSHEDIFDQILSTFKFTD